MKENRLICKFEKPKTLSSNQEVVELENDIKALNDNRQKWERDKKAPNLDKTKLDKLENLIRAETQSILNRLNYYSTRGIDSPINDVHREVDFRGLDINKVPKITKKTHTNYTDFAITLSKPHEKGIHVRMSKTTTQTLSKSIYKDKSINGGILSHGAIISSMQSIKKIRSRVKDKVPDQEGGDGISFDLNELDNHTWKVLGALINSLGKPNDQPLRNIRDAYSNARQGFILDTTIPEIIDKGGYLIIKYEAYGLEKLTININEGKVIYTQQTLIKRKKPLIKPKKKSLTKAEKEKKEAKEIHRDIGKVITVELKPRDKEKNVAEIIHNSGFDKTSTPLDITKPRGLVFKQINSDGLCRIQDKSRSGPSKSIEVKLYAPDYANQIENALIELNYAFNYIDKERTKLTVFSKKELDKKYKEAPKDNEWGPVIKGTKEAIKISGTKKVGVIEGLKKITTLWPYNIIKKRKPFLCKFLSLCEKKDRGGIKTFLRENPVVAFGVFSAIAAMQKGKSGGKKIKSGISYWFRW